MKTICAVMVVGLTIVGSVAPAFAQPYGGRDYGYGGRDDGYRDRDRGYDGRGRGGGGGYGFDESEYLRCNPDVRRAISRGQMESGAAHYRAFGRREGRRLSC
ncbi:hypothetical protein FV226_22035 [Methylobacterium sp. WL12]|uniref:hypothetical protein n=1 Tax=Methylobacterium sp. WL12 TaxID=2603890 RepID=UPI0011CA6155|nr:hypothetical protein [Methylobacterium sp. WL12]TXM67414.1 hypothetical protein FV226_22035 [Methylobacterium sp. WL12]